MVVERRFAFVETLKDGRERLMQAELNPLTKFGPRTARIVRELGVMPGDHPNNGIVPQSYRRIRPSRSNAYLAAFSAEVGQGFVDYNIRIHDQETGEGPPRFNEHSFSGTNRSTCIPPVFAAFLASEAASGVPADIIAGYDYSVVTEGANIGEPELVWTTEDTLLVRYGFDVMSGSAALGRDYFEFEIAPDMPTLTVLSVNAGKRPGTRPPVDYFTILGGHSGGRRIAFRKVVLPFASGLRKYFSWPWLFPGIVSYRVADRVAGYAR